MPKNLSDLLGFPRHGCLPCHWALSLRTNTHDELWPARPWTTAFAPWIASRRSPQILKWFGIPEDEIFSRRELCSMKTMGTREQRFEAQILVFFLD
ncbi:Uncharacterized protein FKW44_022154 [Caligus rogercresseyi]|uniref:Uncharacterized protein n=1 Tax=Caligus rogercresseyi TaxID=217165 RepID=A0A7T8GSA8_CALRO|nr:Uncharacterized protein FKW44_022154 [Caligus rogercresseyi]